MKGKIDSKLLHTITVTDQTLLKYWQQVTQFTTSQQQILMNIISMYLGHTMKFCINQFRNKWLINVNQLPTTGTSVQ